MRFPIDLRSLFKNLNDRIDAICSELPRHPERDRKLHLDRVDLVARSHLRKFAQRGYRILKMTIGKSLEEILRATARISEPEARDNSMRRESYDESLERPMNEIVSRRNARRARRA